MKIILFASSLFIIASILDACSKQTTADMTLSQKLATDTLLFEIRDFVLEKEDKSGVMGFHYLSYKGRGTVVVKNLDYQDQNLLLILKIKNKSRPEGKEYLKEIWIEKGIGVLETYDSEIAPDYEWRVIGWSLLNDGKISVH